MGYLFKAKKKAKSAKGNALLNKAFPLKSSLKTFPFKNLSLHNCFSLFCFFFLFSFYINKELKTFLYALFTRKKGQKAARGEAYPAKRSPLCITLAAKCSNSLFMLFILFLSIFLYGKHKNFFIKGSIS